VVKKLKKVLIALIVIIVGASIIYFYNKNQQKPSNPEIEEIKQETGMTAKDELYEINVEYDGKKVLNIKPEIQYKIAFAGISKKRIPELSEVDKVFEKEYPKNKGVWIDSSSRQDFLELLKSNTNNEYEITDGYLKIKQEKNPNEEDNALRKMIEGENKYIISISGIYYEADRVTGEIFDNFFEDMDPYQASKTIQWDENYIITLSTNQAERLTNKEILQEVTFYGK